MSTTSPLPLIAASVTVGTLACLIYTFKDIGSREPHLPPGPPTIPLLGNLHAFPKSALHLKFTEWSREYGEIYSLKIGAGTAIVLSSTAATTELLEKRSATTADRPPNHMADLVTGGRHMALARCDDKWRALRRAGHQILSPQACEAHLPIQQAEATQLMFDLLTTPEDFWNSISRYSHSVIKSVLWGQRSPRFDSPDIKEFFCMEDMWEYALLPGGHPPVDLIPILQLVPERFAEWKTLCKKIRNMQNKIYFELLDQMEKRVARGDSNGCWMETIAERSETWKLDREDIGYLGGALIEGGSTTSTSLIQSLILALVANPDVQRKAHEEMDRVVGTDRAPTIEDMNNLPYCQAIIYETERWRPVTPLGVPHGTTADETYKGYVIPAGATIFVNCWAICHDAEVYDDPESFNPDRYLQSEFGTKPEAREGDKDRRHTFQFGFGRRMCPGINLASNSLRFNFMNLLWAFDFLKALDPDTGAEIEPDVWNYVEGLGTAPAPFKCRIRPRSPRHAEIIERNFLQASTVFEQFEHELSEADRQYVTKLRADLAKKYSR